MTILLEDTLNLEEITIHGYEKVVKVSDLKSGLKAIICIHNTRMGPSLGGIRIYPYSSEELALKDVLRLAKGMTYKSTLAHSGLGGGKSVIIADPKKDKIEDLLLSFGRAISALKGLYIGAEDVGCSVDNMATIRRTTPYVVGLAYEKSSGDPSPFTAWGVVRGIQSVLAKAYGNDSLKGRKIAIQGLGNVGSKVAEWLFWLGARLVLSDLDEKKTDFLARKLGAETCLPSEIFKVDCDVFSPCALGAILNSETIPQLRCKAVAGAANNQLLNDSDADLLFKRGILYAPDFVINAGGLINVVEELAPLGYDSDISRHKVDQIYDHLMLIYEIAEKNHSSTNRAAVDLGDYRLKYEIGKRKDPIHFHHADIILDKAHAKYS